MNTANNNPLLASAHRDVLQAPIPDTVEGKRQLMEELKTRGRSAVGAKAWMDASFLYQRAIEITDSEEVFVKDSAILHANLSLAQRNTNQLEQSRRAAEIATQLDPNYVKGWWRLGQALQSLHRIDDALQAMTKAKELEPSNKALLKECEKLEKQLKEERELMMDIDAPETTKSTDIKKKVTTTSTAVPKQSSNKNKSSTTTTTAEVDSDTFTKSDHVKGYKVVNGKKTSYFHNELTEEAKELIGDIAPKKIQQESTAQTKTAKGASAWNQAGTWEERDVTQWAIDSLKKSLLETSFTLPDSSPAPGVLTKVAGVPKLDGHASFATVRGKKRYIYEFHIRLQWEIDAPLSCRGSMEFPDMDGTCELGEGYDMTNFTVTDWGDDKGVGPLLDRFVKNGGLRDVVHQTMDDWVRNFRETY